MSDYDRSCIKCGKYLSLDDDYLYITEFNLPVCNRCLNSDKTNQEVNNNDDNN